VTARITKYETRLIIFLDFLGFRDVVERTKSNISYLHWLLDGIDDLSHVVYNSGYTRTRQITVFSDSIAISYAALEERDPYWVFTHLCSSLSDLVAEGFLIRGAVTIGDLVHTDKYLVGPAMVRAYELESTVAKYPRVIIDPIFFEKTLLKRKKRRSYYFRDMLVKDNDKQIYFDYFKPKSLFTIAKLISKGLRNDDPTVVSKYLWMYGKYVTAIDRFGRKKKSEYFKEIRDLPRMKGLAKKARKMVSKGGR
jgi:hypothetical protein